MAQGDHKYLICSSVPLTAKLSSTATVRQNWRDSPQNDPIYPQDGTEGCRVAVPECRGRPAPLAAPRQEPPRGGPRAPPSPAPPAAAARERRGGSGDPGPARGGTLMCHLCPRLGGNRLLHASPRELGHRRVRLDGRGRFFPQVWWGLTSILSASHTPHSFTQHRKSHHMGSSMGITHQIVLPFYQKTKTKPQN